MTCSGPPSPKAGSCSDSAGQLGPSGCSQGAKSEVHSPSLLSPALCRSLPHLDSTSPLTPQGRLCPLLAPCHLTSLGHVVLNLPSPPRGPISPGPWRPPCHGPSGPVHLDALRSSLPGSTCWGGAVPLSSPSLVLEASLVPLSSRRAHSVLASDWLIPSSTLAVSPDAAPDNGCDMVCNSPCSRS